MTGTLSHKFIAALDPKRDGLYGAALARFGDSAAAGREIQEKTERLLQAAIREGFAAVEKDPAADPLAAVEAALGKPADRPAAAGEVSPVMPADLWARLVATIQVEAARSAHTRALNPDSVLLSPDPLLAPKKSTGPDDADGFDLAPSFRFLLAAAIAVVVGVGLTIYLLTRGGGAVPASRPAGNPDTVPATLHAPPIPPAPVPATSGNLP